MQIKRGLQNNVAEPKTNLVGLIRSELEKVLVDAGLAKFRAKQVWHWMYHKGTTDFSEMTTLSIIIREELSQAYVLSRPDISQEQRSVDGTVKWLLRFLDGTEVETVFIPEKDRGTLCISSQVGCTLTCSFCHTGTQRLVRNLEPSEIVGQVLTAMDSLEAWPSAQPGRPITNIVLMGMGEPLYNLDLSLIHISEPTRPY